MSLSDDVLNVKLCAYFMSLVNNNNNNNKHDNVYGAVMMVNVYSKHSE